MTTIHDVAKAAAVSSATVSHVLNSTRPVAPATRQRVEQVIKKLHYRPNAMARSLNHNSSHMIGLIVWNLALPLTGQIYHRLDKLLRPRGFTLMVRTIDEDGDREALHLDEFLGRRVDGVFLFPTGQKLDQYDACAKAGIPLIFLDARPKNVAAPLIEMDSIRAGREAASHLIGLGHERIAFLSRKVAYPAFALREQGYRRAMKARGLTPEIHRVEGNIDRIIPNAASLVARLLSGPKPPTAVIASSHALSLGLMEGARASGAICPRDVSMICFEDSPWARFVDPPLTVMGHPVEAMSGAAVEAMLAGIQAVTARKNKGITPALRPRATVTRFQACFVERGSCGPPPPSTP